LPSRDNCLKQKEMNYSKQLEDERWQAKRRKILQRDKFKCTKCGYEDNLHVHHLYYIHFNKAWQCPNNALVTLCGRCHSKWHEEHEIEVREDSYSRPNKEYIPPVKKKISRSEKKKKRIEKERRQHDKLMSIAEELNLDTKYIRILNIIEYNKFSVAVHLLRTYKTKEIIII
jgi:hypothetical protein